MLGKAYTGSGATASGVAMDKVLTKKLVAAAGIKTPKSFENVKVIDSYPVVIKPALEGSSVGIYFCNNEDEAKKAVEALGDKKIVIEEMIAGDELTVGVINGEGLGVLRIIPKNEFYDYESKYALGGSVHEYPAKIDKKAELTVGVINGEGLGVLRIIPKNEFYDYESKYALGGSVHEYPAKIDKKAYDEALKNAVKVHEVLGLKGISRSDFLLKDNELYFLEVNTLPGMTKTSLIPDLATLKGYSY